MVRKKFTKVLGIVPSRKCSKRLPEKNKMKFFGKELWKRAVDTALYCMDRVVVTTDDDEILNDKTYDISSGVIFSRRSEKASVDTATMDEVVQDVLYDIKKIAPYIYNHSDTICVIQPTSPLLKQYTLFNALQHFYDNDLRCLVSVNVLLKPNGAFYIFKRKEFEKYKTIWMPNLNVYFMSITESIDIDYIWDFRIAEAVYSDRYA